MATCSVFYLWLTVVVRHQPVESSQVQQAAHHPDGLA